MIGDPLVVICFSDQQMVESISNVLGNRINFSIRGTKRLMRVELTLEERYHNARSDYYLIIPDIIPDLTVFLINYFEKKTLDHFVRFIFEK